MSDFSQASLPPEMARAVGRVVLVGFMGAGKTTVGPMLAHRLGFRFVDLDGEVERRAGATIAEIFATRGEAGFRALEAEATRSLDDQSRLVVAAGGGWMARPELRDRWPDAVRIWLRVGPETAVARLSGRLHTRPLLAGPAEAVSGRPGSRPAPEPGSEAAPHAVARRLLETRKAAYRLAEITVETDGRTPEEVAGAVLHALGNLSPSSRLPVKAPHPAHASASRAQAPARRAHAEPSRTQAPNLDPRRTRTEDGRP